MHRHDKFKNLLVKLYKEGYYQWTTPNILKIIKNEFKVSDRTASVYLKEMVSWKLLEQDGFTFTNVYYKKVV